MTKAKMLWVEWVDSAATNGWLRPDYICATPMTCQTVGFFVRESKDGLVLALNHCGDANSARPFGECITIPRVAIAKRRKVRL